MIDTSVQYAWRYSKMNLVNLSNQTCFFSIKMEIYYVVVGNDDLSLNHQGIFIICTWSIKA